jgi:hypothetical protein
MCIGCGRSVPGGGGPGRYIPVVGGIGGGGGGPMSSTGARVWVSALRAAEPLMAWSSTIASGAGRWRVKGGGGRRRTARDALLSGWRTRRRRREQSFTLWNCSDLRQIWGFSYKGNGPAGPERNGGWNGIKVSSWRGGTLGIWEGVSGCRLASNERWLWVLIWSLEFYIRLFALFRAVGTW